jgi:hypothetical protein
MIQNADICFASSNIAIAAAVTLSFCKKNCLRSIFFLLQIVVWVLGGMKTMLCREKSLGLFSLYVY